VTFTIGQSTQDKLRYVQELLGHQIPSGDLAALFDRALDALSTRLEKQKFGATDKPRGVMVRSSEPSRHIPAGVRRAVWKRDRGRCTFVGDSGRRCSARSGIEFDHIDPVARGGESTAANLRLRCRAHNQFEAERAFGTAFIEAKREAARRDAEEREGKEQERDLIAGLRGLGFRAGEARRGLESIAGVPSLSLEERIRLALSSLGRSPRLGKTIRSSAA
jgi:hypothetical protein